MFFSLLSKAGIMASRYQLSDESGGDGLYSIGRGRGVMGVRFESSGSVGRDMGASPVLPVSEVGA